MPGLEFNRNAWYYKLVYNNIKATPSDSLCVFFWQLVWCLLKAGVIWTFFGICVVGLLFSWYYIPVMNDWQIEPQAAIHPIMLIPLVLGYFCNAFIMMFLLAGAFRVMVEGIAWVIRKLTGAIPKPKARGPLVEYIMAKKQRVCPKIDWQDE